MIFKSALAAKAVDPDAIDKVIRDYITDQARLNSYVELDFLPFDPVAKRTEATVKSPEGETITVRVEKIASREVSSAKKMSKRQFSKAGCFCFPADCSLAFSLIILI